LYCFFRKIQNVASAKNGKVNVYPNGLDTLKVLDKNKVIWLRIGGSGNETETQIADTNQMTLMFCTLEGSPLIVRLDGTAKSIRPENESWESMILLFPTNLARTVDAQVAGRFSCP
jgi:hypothetical protein